MLTFPKNGIWTQPNISDVKGDIWTSFNIDVAENEGRMRLGKRMILNTGTPDVAQITSYPCAFVGGVGSSNYMIAGASGTGYAFLNDGSMTGAFTKDTDVSAPTTVDSTTSDAVYSNNSMYISAISGGFVYLYKKIGNAWHSPVITSATPGTNTANMLCSYQGRTYCSNNQSQIFSFDSTDTPVAYSGTYSLTLGVPGDFTNVITKLLPADDRMFILTVNTTGGKGYIYEWDGSSITTTLQHRMESAGALAGIMYDGTPYIVDVNANLFAWNGGTFVKVAGLNRKRNLPLYNPISLVNNRFIHPNGISVVNNRIQILIDNRNYDSASDIEETIPSGIYEFDPLNPTKGLIHKGSIANNKAGDTINCYGSVRINGAGALKEMGVYSNASGANGTVFAGAGYYTDASTIQYGVFYDDRNDTLQKCGYFISTILDADDGTVYHLPSVEDDWLSLYTMYRNFLNSTDKIVPKYRTSKNESVQTNITWISTTQFTTTTNLTSSKGYEVEVLQGIGAGKCSHITNVTGSGTYTVTVDETYTGASGTAIIRVQNWRKISSITQNNQNFNSDTISDKGTWIQLKVMMLFTGRDELERLILTNSNINPAT